MGSGDLDVAPIALQDMPHPKPAALALATVGQRVSVLQTMAHPSPITYAALVAQHGIIICANSSTNPTNILPQATARPLPNTYVASAARQDIPLIAPILTYIVLQAMAYPPPII